MSDISGWQRSGSAHGIADTFVILGIAISGNYVARFHLNLPAAPILALLLALIVVWPAAWLALRRKLNLRAPGWFWNAPRQYIWQAGAFAAIGGVIVTGFQIVFQGRVFAASAGLPSGLAELRGNIPALAALGVQMILLAPLAEEFFFRGVILQGLFPTLKFAPSLLVNGIVFALWHSWPLPGLILTGVLGLLLGALYFRTASLWANILCHSFLNAVGFTLMLIGIYSSA